MQAGKRIERILQSLLLKGRIGGIHVVMATYRFDKGIITPAIQAFFPSRLAFRLRNKLDSKVILNTQDAVNLIGRGDLLLFDTSLKRIQGVYIDDNEIKNICAGISKKYIKEKTYIFRTYHWIYMRMKMIN